MRARLEEYYRAEGLGPLPALLTVGNDVNGDLLAVLLETKPEIVSFHWGLPNPDILDALKRNGTFIIGCATTIVEARKPESLGADAIVAQGAEAGGHRGTFTGVAIGAQAGLFALLPQIVDACSVPVIAAGGIADGRGIAAALTLGADAVRIGTAFLRCPEALVLDDHREALAHADDASTVVTPVLSGKPARVIRNQLVNDLGNVDGGPLPFPAQVSLTRPLEATGKIELLQLYAGQAAALARELPAGDLMARLEEETEACFQKMVS